MNKEKVELKEMTNEQLLEKVDSFRQELFSLRFNKQTVHIKNYSQYKKLRKNIARALTYLNEKRSDQR